MNSDGGQESFHNIHGRKFKLRLGQPHAGDISEFSWKHVKIIENSGEVCEKLWNSLELRKSIDK